MAAVVKVQCNEILDKMSSRTVSFKIQVCVSKPKCLKIYDCFHIVGGLISTHLNNNMVKVVYWGLMDN